MSAKLPRLDLLNGGEVIVSHAGISRAVSRLVSSGKLRKLASRLYTSDLESAPGVIVRRNLWDIVAGYFPGALVADRTALEIEPATADGSMCLVTNSGADIQLPGVRLRPRRGAPPQSDDRPFMKGLYLSSPARAFLDNLRPSRARGGRCRRTLPRAEVEARLEQLLSTDGAAAVGRMWDDARRLAQRIGREAEVLAGMLGAMSGTREAPLVSDIARARARREPYDAPCLELCGRLQRALLRTPPKPCPAASRDGIGESTLAFYDAYFSNFIEGTEFEVEEAERIVFKGRIPSERPADAHDILGVWRVVSDSAGMRRLPGTADELLETLRTRHEQVKGGRPEQGPGRFKSVANHAGGTTFVAPEAVVGTLRRGFELYGTLEAPFSRAVFVHMLVSEVHPFADGNGRVARIMMNAELVAANEERIVIPTVYRPDYIASQRALSGHGESTPVMRMLDFAQRWTHAVEWTTVAKTARSLEGTGAFLTEVQADAAGRRRRMPSG